MDMNMIETFYLFIFVDESTYEMTCAINFKDAVWEMAKYTGCGSEIFLKSLKGFEPDDIEGIISIFNHFSASTISKVYIIEKKIYDNKKGGVLYEKEK